MAKRKKMKLKKKEAAVYREVAARALKKLEMANPAGPINGFLVHDDAVVELAASQKYVWVDAKVLVRVTRTKVEKRAKPTLAAVPTTTAEATA